MANNLAAGKGEAWASMLQEVLREAFVGSQIANTKFEGLFDGNDTVHFPKLAKITSQDLASSYSSVTVQDLVETDETFVLDTRKQSAFEISNEDMKELRVSPETQAIKDMAEAFASDYDTAILGQYANAAYTIDAGNVGGTGGTAATLTKSNIYQFIVETGKTLDENNVPSSDRFIVFSPAEKALLLQAPELIRSTEYGDKLVTGGFMGTVDDFKIYWSNNLTDVASVKHALAGAGKPVSFAANIKPSVEITPSQYRDSFVSLVKAQTKFGVKTFTEGANRLADLQIAS